MQEPLEASLTQWAYFRFSIIGELLANPPKKGELHDRIEKLAEKQYQHPVKGTPFKISASTIERWYYKALKSDDPIDALTRKSRSDSGTTKVMTPHILGLLEAQYRLYPNWSYQLHADNLKAAIKEKPELGDMPSYSTVLRRMQERGWIKKRLARTPGQKQAEERLLQREVRSYESEYVHGLWHLDFHEASRVVDVDGSWHTPRVLCIMDDHSRLCCHIQWYLRETAENLSHGLVQAFYKRGLPRSLMSDQGAAMTALETRNGLARLGISHDMTLPYSPYQNGKQEKFWGQVEGRLLPMLSRVEPLTLHFLNQATQAWVEEEYNRSLHSEIATTPLKRMLNGSDVSRPVPENEEIRRAFTVRDSRLQRKSDGTIQIKGTRFEIPSCFRHLKRLHVRYQSWDLSRGWLVDSRTDVVISHIYPIDKTKNAEGERRALEPLGEMVKPLETDADPIPPLLRKLLSDYAATGLPPAYIPQKGEK